MTKKRIEQQNIDTIHLVSILFLILCPIIGLFPLYFVNKARNKYDYICSFVCSNSMLPYLIV